MDYLSAVRTFGNAGFSPAKKVRIRNDRWYFVRMQNVVRDQGDGMYLGDGEYVQLLPGKVTRERRDAHLNHCNGIAEYTGEVFALTTYPYNNPMPFPETYYPNDTELQEAIVKFQAKKDTWITAMEKQRVKYLMQTPASIVANAKRTGIGVALIDDQSWIDEKVQWYIDRAAEVQAQIDKHRDVAWRYEVRKVR